MSQYVGHELDFFEKAVNWKAYFISRMAGYVHGHVLEVGAGNGINTQLMLGRFSGIQSWLSLEPDSDLAARVSARNLKVNGGQAVEVKAGTLSTFSADRHFHTILYIDVLEHIQQDADELQKAAQHLAPGGKLIVLSPAHQFLFSPFDQAIGHHRRYDRPSLLRVAPQELKLITLEYLDSFGMLASLGQRLLLKQRMPTQSQILIWDRFFVPFSRILDPLTAHLLGKTILAVWQKP